MQGRTPLHYMRGLPMDNQLFWGMGGNFTSCPWVRDWWSDIADSGVQVECSEVDWSGLI